MQKNIKVIKWKKKSPCWDSNLENAALQYSVLPVELQRWLVNLRQTAVMNLHIYVYLHIYFLECHPALCIDTLILLFAIYVTGGGLDNPAE